ncbi:hypothetical protein, conserved [Trypanosoma brucei brucei TREU927]|uniref:Uncharacterized protein n=1 Tax=Trypanosoma brucei brucei (strain 927/4 GUTat10.1) TaxID=185431 RepID=Q38BB5_TRYB2|nr:hypothetical protein, conserved [Trypanosoma brucei brucei TREU927]EAN77905.1 hypothetical protein, conserved [Trypanosoma brucei brucei TREU927]
MSGMQAPFQGGVSNIFSTPTAPFSARQLFHIAGRPAESTVSGGGSFTQEDRLMLQLLYQQQQAFQIQLQSMALSLQQLYMAISALPHLNASTTKHDSEDASQSAPVHTALSASVGAPLTAVDAPVTSSSVRGRAGEHREDAVVTERQPSTAQHQGEVSRSCTPPPGDSDVSRQSMMNRSSESAAPWDPSAGSRHSSATRGVRGENPLLSSLRGKLPTPNRSAITSTSVATGHSASMNVSVNQDDPKPTARPTARSSTSSASRLDYGARHVTSSLFSSAPSEEKHHHQRARKRIVPSSRKVDASHVTRREEEFIPPHTGTSGSGPVVGSSVTGGVSCGEELQSVKGWNSSRGWNQPDKDEFGETSASVTGYDSQSDGYGSYETRQYLKTVGLI